jgi:hypothetical protein
MSNRADSMLVYDLRGLASNYGGGLGSRLTTAANELDRLYEIERALEALLAAGVLNPTGSTRVDGAVQFARASLGKVSTPVTHDEDGARK